jgi:coproporphyrinogen III oxidase-like Fe-S oxidoreductase
MDQQERNIEKLFLSLRTDRGVENLSSYEHILEKNRKELINAFEKQGYCLYENDKLLLTDSGMDIYNTIITDLLAQL